MKKILLINLALCVIVCLELIFVISEKQDCNMQCNIKQQDIKIKEINMDGGAETDQQLFPFNNVYIKI